MISYDFDVTLQLLTSYLKLDYVLDLFSTFKHFKNYIKIFTFVVILPKILVGTHKHSLVKNIVIVMSNLDEAYI